MRRTRRTLLGIMMVLVSTAGLSAASYASFGFGFDTSGLQLSTENLNVLNLTGLTLGGGSGAFSSEAVAPISLTSEVAAFAAYNMSALLRAERERYDQLDASRAELREIQAECAADRAAIQANSRSNVSYSRDMARIDIDALDTQCRFAQNVLQNSVRSLERSSYRVNIRDPIVDQHRQILQDRSRVAEEMGRIQSTCDAQAARIVARGGASTDEVRAAQTRNDLNALATSCAAQTARVQNQVDAYTQALDNIEAMDIDERYANAVLGAAQGYRARSSSIYDALGSSRGFGGSSDFFGRGGFFR